MSEPWYDALCESVRGTLEQSKNVSEAKKRGLDDDLIEPAQSAARATILTIATLFAKRMPGIDIVQIVKDFGLEDEIPHLAYVLEQLIKEQQTKELDS
jgi:hypothetical protein